MSAPILVHNISDIGTNPVAVSVAGRLLRPGQSAVLVLSPSEEASPLIGTTLWLGSLPAAVRKARLAKQNPVHTGSEDIEAKVQAHLAACDVPSLTSYARSLGLGFSPKSRASLTRAITRAILRSPDTLDPEVFFWLGRWRRTSSGDYQLI